MATKFLKKLFSIDGKSPDRRTNMFIVAKQKADVNMQRIPLYFVFMMVITYSNEKIQSIRKKDI